ncbi:MAG: helix-turn-helix domain-containing protein [Ruminococcaceae bacterium]|nr:helix-turn-helix domain-containing protein [Oscillospiraceae bacterium]
MLLIIDKCQSNANAASDIFNHMGILSYGTTPELASLEFSNRHRAILFMHPERMVSAVDLVELARTYSLDSCVFAIMDEGYEGHQLSALFDKVFTDGSLSSKIVYDILTYQTDRGKGALGTYRMAGIEASVHNSETTYFDIPLNLTKTETMILRYLIASFPIAQSGKRILKYAFRSGRLPEISSIRAHISSINRKFKDIAKRTIISNVQGSGYKITPV